MGSFQQERLVKLLLELLVEGLELLVEGSELDSPVHWLSALVGSLACPM